MNKFSTAVLIIFFCNAALAEIYKWTDSAGRVHYSDKPLTDKPVEIVDIKINSYESVSFEDLPDGFKPISGTANKKVIMYATSWCGFCKQARAYFSKKHIPYKEYDVEKNQLAKQKYDALGGKGVPVILVGQKRMNGFNVAEFEKIYK